MPERLGGAGLGRGCSGRPRGRRAGTVRCGWFGDLQIDNKTETAVARELGIPELSFFSRTHYGGGAACATVRRAAMTVATGTAEVVVCYRTFNEWSGSRFGQVQAAAAGAPTSAGLDNCWSYPVGVATPGAQVAMFARRYLHTYGARRLRPRRSGRPRARRDQSQCLALPAADHPGDHQGSPPRRRCGPCPRLAGIRFGEASQRVWVISLDAVSAGRAALDADPAATALPRHRGVAAALRAFVHSGDLRGSESECDLAAELR